jgi:hypothetical protein
MFSIGCTATPKRSDRQALAAIQPDGTPTMIEDRRGGRRAARADECVYEKHVFSYSLTEALADGWLVVPIGHTQDTKTDLTEVSTEAGDWQQKQLAETVNNAERTNVAFNRWKLIAEDRPTIAFCVDVPHAHHSAELWRQAGYTAEAIDGKMLPGRRQGIIRDFKAGRVQVITNCAVLTEGADFPTCSCVVHLRPTKSWSLYSQMCGRAIRALKGVLDGLETAQERIAAIAASGKPDAIILDMVDISAGQDLCTAPTLLDLPAGMKLQGQSIVAAAELVKEFEAVKGEIVGPCPITFAEMEGGVKSVQLFNRRKEEATRANWDAIKQGFRFARVQPPYQANLIALPEDACKMEVKHKKETIEVIEWEGGGKFSAYLAEASQLSHEIIQRHVSTHADEAKWHKRCRRGSEASEKQKKFLADQKHPRADAPALTKWKASEFIDEIVQKRKAVSADLHQWRAQQQEAA